MFLPSTLPELLAHFIFYSVYVSLVPSFLGSLSCYSVQIITSEGTVVIDVGQQVDLLE